MNHIAAIHILKAQCQLTEEDYRALLREMTGKDSCKALGPVQLAKVRQHMDNLAVRLGVAKTSPLNQNAKRLKGSAALMWSLWQQCVDAKVLRDRRYAALEAFAKGLTGVAKLEWLLNPQKDMVIKALKTMKNRGATGV